MLIYDLYQHNLSDSGFCSYHYVFVDESGSDKRGRFRQMGWSPFGVTPIEIAWFQHEQRYQILLAYTQDGIVLTGCLRGFSLGSRPEPKSILVMGNASFHHIKRIGHMCYEAGVKLIYLLPYSPDFNPIEDLFAEFKAFTKRNWGIYGENLQQSFDTFLE